MKFSLSLLFLIFLFRINALAQTMPISKDSLTMNADARVMKLQQKYIEINKLKQSCAGYRIQIHFGNEREKAKEIKTKFLKEFPEIPAYDSYQSPNFRVRVGDYRSKLEASKQLKQISTLFPSSFIVSDNIKYPKLIVD
ncbi:MAG TPA: SPOR domain-containing protein [Bacteroidia bacterium]|nr:SPOR domain-containing protein [Bacteroidia bacterium]